MPEAELRSIIAARIAELGEDLLIMAHHYQKDEVVDYAQVIGDSLYLSMQAAQNKRAKHIIFCGVHFMAETAAMLTEDWQNVYLPDENAGCSMADMATRQEVECAWQQLSDIYGEENLLPITYVNSTADIKAFVGEHDGTCVTSTNASQIVKWALESGKRVVFLPDQHLGRNTAYSLGIPLEQMILWLHKENQLDTSDPAKIDAAQVILWDGYCGVHQQFTLADVENIRKLDSEVQVIVHPECRFEVVQAADLSGSTNKLQQIVDEAPLGSSFAIGTDNNLVGRIRKKYEGVKQVHFLNFYSCPCVTMNRIRLPHLAWNLDNIAAGDQVQKITVDEQTTTFARKSLDKMFSLT